MLALRRADRFVKLDACVKPADAVAGGGNYPLNGTYTPTIITLSGQGPGSGAQWSTTLRLRKQ
jgi:hypothetical protein